MHSSPFELNIVPVRQAIDEALCQALNLPDLTPVREILAQEPGLTGKPILSQPEAKTKY